MRIALALTLLMAAGCAATPTPTGALPERPLPPGASAGGRIVLERHDGPRDYYLCD